MKKLWKKAGYDKGQYWIKNSETKELKGFPVFFHMGEDGYEDAKARRKEWLKENNR